ncbi:unnamed protein product [Toxocara canis]|nr:unnamed protein product [Toxocara canis]
MISLVWIISVLANFFMLFMFELQSYNINGLTCAPRYKPIIHFGYQIYMTSVLLLIPLFLMIALYGSVIHSLKMGMKLDIAAVGGSIFDTENSIDDIDQEIQRPSLYQRLRSTVRFHRKCASDFVQRKSKSARACMGDGIVRPDAIPSSSSVYARSISVTGLTTEQRLRSTHSEKAFIAKQRVIRMLIVIVIIFFCCWTPNYMWWLLLTAQDSFQAFDVWNSQLNTAITVLCYISSCANPITYCFLNKKFRTALLLSFGCRKAAMRRHHFQKVYLPVNGAVNNNVSPPQKTEEDFAAAVRSSANGVRTHYPPRSSSMTLRERGRVYNNGGRLSNKQCANDGFLLKSEEEAVNEVLLDKKSKSGEEQSYTRTKSNGARRSFESNF